MLNLSNLFKDTEYSDKSDMPNIREVDIRGRGYHLYGYVLTPGAEYTGRRPCVIMSHGFPGYTTNNDIEHALRRIGCVVVHVNHRGAWGSEGNYLFSNLPSDIQLITEWVISDKSVSEYNIDVSNIFLVGHSMGGMTVINAARRLPMIKGTVAIAPYDLNHWFESGTEKCLLDMILEEGSCLKMESPQVLFEDAFKYNQELALINAFEDIKSRNILFIGADCDDVAPPDKMIGPLWNKLEQSTIQAVQEYVLIHADHSLCGSRIKLAQTIGSWIAKLAETMEKQNE